MSSVAGQVPEAGWTTFGSCLVKLGSQLVKSPGRGWFFVDGKEGSGGFRSRKIYGGVSDS